MTIVAEEKQELLHILSVALVILHAERMCHVGLSPAGCPPLPHSSTLPKRTTQYSEKKLLKIQGDQKVSVYMTSVL